MLHEATVFDWVWLYEQSKGEISLKELKAALEKENFNYDVLEKWQKQVKAKADSLGFYGGINAGTVFFWTCCAFIGIGAALVFGPISNFDSSSFSDLNSIFIFIFWGFSFAFAGIAGLLINGFFKKALPKRTLKGSLHYRRWMRFKAFLLDFGSFKGMKPDAVALWDRYLVYAIPLGVAGEVTNAMGLSLENSDESMQSVVFRAMGGAGFR